MNECLYCGCNKAPRVSEIVHFTDNNHKNACARNVKTNGYNVHFPPIISNTESNAARRPGVIKACSNVSLHCLFILTCSPQATFPPPPKDKKYLTFSHIFGTTTSSLETFLLERKIKGPCWLEVKQPEQVQAKVSWCKLEATCDKMEHVSVIRDGTDLEPPPIVVATVSSLIFLEYIEFRTFL